MEQQFEVKKGAGGKVLVILHPTCGIGRGGILELLRQAGIDPADVTFAEPSDAAGGEAQDRCVVIPIDAAVSEAPELADAARRCSQTSSGLVVVFAEGFDYPGLHPIAGAYGTQCGWRPEELRPRIAAGDESSGPLTSSGNAVERPLPSQVKC